jgi:Glycosyl transferase family 64 domain
MLNWRRTEHARMNAVRCSGYKLASEIIVFTNADAPLDLSSCARPPVQITASVDLGLYSRFAAAALARNECILHLDDDLIVPEETVNQLYHLWRADPTVCHSLHGRDVRHGYRFEDAYGAVDVVLTRCLMVSRELCAHALTHVHHFDNLAPEPNGNGEDMILSFTAMKLSRRLNQAHDLPLTNLPGYREGVNGQSTVSIHKRWSGHAIHRARLLERCREYFEIGPQELHAGASDSLHR